MCNFGIFLQSSEDVKSKSNNQIWITDISGAMIETQNLNADQSNAFAPISKGLKFVLSLGRRFDFN